MAACIEQVVRDLIEVRPVPVQADTGAGNDAELAIFDEAGAAETRRQVEALIEEAP